MKQIINEIKPMDFVSVTVKVLSAAHQEMVNSLKLHECVATGDNESFINITIFEELIDIVHIDMTYFIFNVQVVMYNVDLKHNTGNCKMHCLQFHAASIPMSNRFIVKIKRFQKKLLV